MSVQSEQLCLSCGLCCDGTIFADVKLSDADHLLLKQLAVKGQASPLSPRRCKSLRQPCPAFQGGKCVIYEHRPGHCRNFDCALLQRAASGEVSPIQAQSIIRTCKRKAEKVRRLLRAVGNTDEHLAIFTRYRRTIRHYEQHPCADDIRAKLGELSIAAHELTAMLSKHFYP